MNTTRTVFAKHRQGYIFPLLLNVKPMENSFAGVLQRLPTQDNFVLFFSQSFIVSAATQESLGMMGVRVLVSLAFWPYMLSFQRGAVLGPQVTPLDVDDGLVDLSKYISKQSLEELLELAQEAQERNDNKPMRKKKIEISNLSKSYVQGLASQNDAFAFSKKKIKSATGNKMLVWARVQVLRFTRNGTMKEDMDNNVVNE